jgi:DNA polymerase
LYRHATQTVFGGGSLRPRLMLVGEQPGDREDVQGKPFFGPAGKMLDRALEEAGIDRSAAYVTNAVKHFKFLQRGKRRLHQKPDNAEIEACKFWILQELDALRPSLVMAMGATAARALTGRTLPIGKQRGRVLPYPPHGELMVTVHPSYLLRLPNAEAKATEYARFVADLRLAREHLDGRAGSREGAKAEGGQLGLLR